MPNLEAAMSDTPFNVAEADRLLSTTRAVRRRLDFDKPVPDQLLLYCIDVAEQAPSGGNDASRRWVVVRDPAVKSELGEMYRNAGQFMGRIADRPDDSGHPKEEVFKSGAYLVDNFAKAPVLVIAAIWGEHDNSGRPGLFDSVVQSAWSFNVALRARGLGSAWTTMLNANVEGLASVLGIPEGVTTIVTFPVAYTVGTDFKPVARRPAHEITYFDQWGYTRQSASADGQARVVDGPGVVAEIDIDARPSAVWPHINDINMPAAFSTEFQGANWVDDNRGVGAVFMGRNKLGDREWEVPCTVTAYDEKRVFEWATGDLDSPGATWRFEINEQGAGSRLRFSAILGPGSPTTRAAARDAAKEEGVLNTRRAMLKTNMESTVAGVQRLATA